MTDYGQIPSCVRLDLKPFKAQVDQQKLQDFKQLIKLSPIAPANYENSDESVKGRYGVTRDWMVDAKEHWLNHFDWRRCEDRINSFPNFTTQVQDDLGNGLDVHFVALFSRKADAAPIACYHGWPGSFLEFLQILDLLKDKYSPEALPYHIIVPSIPGYAYSSGPPLDQDYDLDNASEALHNLMVGLGFNTGYYAHGGDLGSTISRYQAAKFEACKGMHLNFAPVSRPRNAKELPLETIEEEAVERSLRHRDIEMAYALEHGTKTATIGMCLSASPIALLSCNRSSLQAAAETLNVTPLPETWLTILPIRLGTDDDPPIEDILESVTLYWMTDTFHRCIFPYRGLFGDDERPRIAKISGRGRPRHYVAKPCGYSFFPKEIMPMPASWVATSCNLVSASTHSSGGHFAAMEKPRELLQDIEQYIQAASKSPEAKL